LKLYLEKKYTNTHTQTHKDMLAWNAGVAQEAVYPLCKALNSNPNPTKKKKKDSWA
jgi:hypothetical protein